MKIEHFVLLSDFETNTYLVWDEESREAMLIDPAEPSKGVLKLIEDEKLQLKYIVNTHGHGDHIGGNRFFKEQSKAGKICIHEFDEQMLLKADLNLSLYYEKTTVSPAADLFLQDGMSLMLGKQEFKVIHTPGHTRGGVCLYSDQYLFSGDTLFAENVGRTDLPGGSFSDLASSIRTKIFVLPGETVVFPGHGDKTTVGDEKRHNPFVGEI